MKTIDNEFIEKAKEAKSVEELMKLAAENGISLTEKEAQESFETMHKNGELGDDELDSVSGGACHLKVNGSKYTVVTSGCKCFTGMYRETTINSQTTSDARADWYTFSSKGCCGKCEFLELHWGIGYCTKSGK